MKVVGVQFILVLVQIQQLEEKIKVNFHLDLIMKKPTVYCDNKKIIENGKIKKI